MDLIKHFENARNAVVIEAGQTIFKQGQRGTVMYVLQGMRRTPGPITDVFSGVMPFVGVYMLAVLILLLFPGLALVLVPR